MATGYVVSGRGDLDALFKARTSSAAAATGFLSNGGVDLNQRFEPRGSSTAIANTNFKVGANDLASIFMDIAAAAGTLIADLSMTAATNSTTQKGFQRGVAVLNDFGFVSSQAVDGSTYLLEQCCTRQDGTGFLFGLSAAGSTFPPDADTTWQRVECTGTFSDGGSPLRTVLRSASLTPTNNLEGGRAFRMWNFNSLVGFISGNVYGVKVYKS